MVIIRIPYSAYTDQECNTAGYMELGGRLTAVNVVWYLFVGAKTVHFAGILLVLWKLILLSTIQCITFAGILIASLGAVITQAKL